MIHKLTNSDFQEILSVVNDAAIALQRQNSHRTLERTIHASPKNLKRKSKAASNSMVTQKMENLIAVMGIQPVNDVTLIRHAYTVTSHQRRGLGEKLLNYLLALAKTQRILVGTWETAPWAIKFYQKHGFVLLSRQETNKLLKKYWCITKRQVETSVVLEYKRKKP